MQYIFQICILQHQKGKNNQTVQSSKDFTEARKQKANLVPIQDQRDQEAVASKYGVTATKINDSYIFDTNCDPGSSVFIEGAWSHWGYDIVVKDQSSSQISETVSVSLALLQGLNNVQ